MVMAMLTPMAADSECGYGVDGGGPPLMLEAAMDMAMATAAVLCAGWFGDANPMAPWHTQCQTETRTRTVPH